MSIFSLKNGQLNQVATTNFASESILERQDLQKAIQQNISVVAPNCLILAEEYAEWDSSRKRIDLLAIDQQANLVIIELKRTDSGDHMELQALRYASMISTMTLEHAVDVYRNYKHKNGDIDLTKEEALADLENFVEIELDETNFGNDVRIVLVSADFSKELTTSVIWLNERDLDITCVRMKPYKFEDNILLDIQQIIPLPEAKDYQVKAQKKAEERREKQKSIAVRDNSRYLFNGKELNKRKLVLEIIHEHIKNKGITSYRQLLEEFPQDLRKGKKLFREFNDAFTNESSRYFMNEYEVLNLEEGKFVISNQWGIGNIQSILDKADSLGYEINIINENAVIVQEVFYQDYCIQKFSNKTITILKNKVIQAPVKPILINLAREININTKNSRGNDKNTRTLGADIIEKLSEMKNV
ncbi:hypothetical protein [Acinetobacter sp. YH12239]|uniref:hypothetical protein n=1 Tax=Acinetobacter sp. YH12239 TaxID=2601166 RepID=UPI0015D360E0|nr:hypothetical protein [Acinetobacter sp. YH12239]